MQRRMRYLRHKHRISIRKLSACSSVSAQRMSQIELNETPCTAHMNSLVKSAFEKVIEQRQHELVALENDYLEHRHNLLDYIEEEEKS